MKEVRNLGFWFALMTSVRPSSTFSPWMFLNSTIIACSSSKALTGGSEDMESVNSKLVICSLCLIASAILAASITSTS